MAIHGHLRASGRLRNAADRDVFVAGFAKEPAGRRQQQAAQTLLTAATTSYDASLDAYGYGVKNLIDLVNAESQLAEARLGAARQFFASFAENTPPRDLKPVCAQLTRYAFSGQGKMLALLLEVRLHPAREESASEISPALIPRIARLLDLAAAFSRQFPSPVNEEQRVKAARIAAMIAAVEAGSADEIENVEEYSPGGGAGLGDANRAAQIWAAQIWATLTCSMRACRFYRTSAR
jgi:hypothetical protein